MFKHDQNLRQPSYHKNLKSVLHFSILHYLPLRSPAKNGKVLKKLEKVLQCVISQTLTRSVYQHNFNPIVEGSCTNLIMVICDGFLIFVLAALDITWFLHEATTYTTRVGKL